MNEGVNKPEAPPWLFENVSEASKNARTLYFVFLTFITYCALTVLNTSDQDVVLNNAVKLPLINVDVPLTMFLVFAPLLALSIFLFFHLYLARLRGMVQNLRDDYSPLPKRRLYPWMLNAAEDPEEGLTGIFQRLVVSVSLWWLLPVVLSLFTVFALKTHLQAISYMLAVATLASALLIVLFWQGFGGRRHVVGPVLLVGASILFVAIQTIYLIPTAISGIPWPDPVAKRSGEVDPLRWAMLRPFISLDISYSVLVEKPPFGTDRIPWADLRHSRLEGANMTATILQRADLRGARLDAAYLEGANLAGALLEGASLKNAVLYKADLRGADLRRANLRNAKLREADLSNANLTGAYLEGAELRYANLSGTILDDANLEGADLLYADASGSRLKNTLLCKSDLRYVNFAGATLSLANLHAVKAEGANFTDAILRKVYIMGANGISTSTLLKVISLYSLTADSEIMKEIQILRPDLLELDLELQLVYALQGILRESGLYHGPIDGKLGPVTLKGLRKLQHRHDLEITGRLDIETVNKIQSLSAKQLPEYRPSLAAEFQHGLDSEKITFDYLREVLREHGFLEIDTPPDLQTAVQAPRFLEAVARFQASVGLIPDGVLGPRTAEKLLQVSQGSIKPTMSVAEAQVLLRYMGAYLGDVKGAYNAEFKQALVNFQGHQCLIPHGLLDKQTATALIVGTSREN